MVELESSDDGIILEATLELIEQAAERIISDFTMTIEKADGSTYTNGSSLETGDSVVFKENMPLCPAIVVATLIGEKLWFIITTSECPDVKCDDHQAMKCVRLNNQNMRIFQDFVNPREDAKIVTEWRSIVKKEAKLDAIIDKISRKWTH